MLYFGGSGGKKKREHGLFRTELLRKVCFKRRLLFPQYMTRTFCPKCGSKKVVDIFCAGCLREERPLVAAFKPFKAVVCSGCGRVKFRGHWQRTTNHVSRLEEDFATLVVSSPSVEVERVSVRLGEIPLKDGLVVKGEASVTVTGRASPAVPFYKEEYLVPFEVENRHCRSCAKSGTYFEGTLQVRNEDAERQAFVREMLQQYGGSIMKEERVRSGTDYYVTSNHALQKSARSLQERYGAVVKSSAHLFGRDAQRSKDLYRETWYVELPGFKPGDAVVMEEKLLFVRELGKKIKFYNPHRGKFEFHQYRQTAFKKVPLFTTTIATVHPEVTVIHPETFQQVRVENVVKKHGPGEEVTVVLYRGKVYLYEVSG